MESKDTILQKEEKMMKDIRDFIPQVVVIRLQSMKLLKELQRQDNNLELATEEMAEAVDALQKAETAMGNAHQNLLISHTTLQAEC